MTMDNKKAEEEMARQEEERVAEAAYKQKDEEDRLEVAALVIE